jgi:uncharacterized protein (DUF885 family)
VTPAELTRARAHALANRYWDRFLALEQLVATEVGDERFDHLLPDLSAEGLYQNDYERLGMLEGQAFRAARLVIDTGIHALGWDRARAIDTMATTGTDRQKCELEVDRHVAMPGQALTYRLGHRAVERWRACAEGRQGARHSLADFRDKVLALGSLPLSVLEAELEQDDG